MSSSESMQKGPGGPTGLGYVGLGFELVIPILVGLYGGYRLDLWLGTKPWFLLVGALLGIAAGFLNFFRRVLPPKGEGPKAGR